MGGRNLQIRKEDSKAELQTIQNQNMTQERTAELMSDMEVLDWTAEQEEQNIIPEQENMFVDKKKHKSHTGYTFKGLGGGTFRNQKEEQTDSAKLTALQIELMNLVKYKDQFDNSADGKEGPASILIAEVNIQVKHFAVQ